MTQELDVPLFLTLQKLKQQVDQETQVQPVTIPHQEEIVIEVLMLEQQIILGESFFINFVLTRINLILLSFLIDL